MDKHGWITLIFSGQVETPGTTVRSCQFLRIKKCASPPGERSAVRPDCAAATASGFGNNCSNDGDTMAGKQYALLWFQNK